MAAVIVNVNTSSNESRVDRIKTYVRLLNGKGRVEEILLYMSVA